MDLRAFFKPKRASPKRASPPKPKSSAGLRGLTLKPIAGWEGCADDITVPRGTKKSVGRAELGRSGRQGVSKQHCTLEARPAALVLQATASFDVIVVHTFTGADKSAETFRRLARHDSVSLEPADRIYMTVNDAFQVGHAAPPKDMCAYAFKVVAATESEVAAAKKAAAAPAAAARTGATLTPEHSAAAAAAATQPYGGTPNAAPPVSSAGKRAADAAGLSAGGASKSPRTSSALSALETAAASSAAAAEPSLTQAPAALSQPIPQQIPQQSSTPASEAPAPQDTPADQTEKERKKAQNRARMLKELASDRGYVGDAQVSPEEAGKMDRRQRRRRSPKEEPKAANPLAAANRKSDEAARSSMRSGAPKPAARSKSAPESKSSPAAAAAASGGALSPEDKGELRSAERSDIERRVEVHWPEPEPNWFGGTIRNFSGEKYRVEYDDGSVHMESLGEDETYFPDPMEEKKCQKPPTPKELVLAFDSELKMALVCRLMGGRPDGGIRVRFIGWSRQNDRTVWPKAKAGKRGAYLLEMTAANKQKAQTLKNNISKIDQAQGDIARSRIGSVVTAGGLSGEQRISDVAIRSAVSGGKLEVLYMLSDKTTWLAESKLLTVDGRSMNGQANPKPSPVMPEPLAPEPPHPAETADAKAAAGVEKEEKAEIPYVVAFQEDWCDLTPDERAAARELGWNPERWDEGEDPTGDEPSCVELEWAGMAESQRTAATVLGFDESNWPPVMPSADLNDEEDPAEAPTQYYSQLGPGPLVPCNRSLQSKQWRVARNTAGQHLLLEMEEAVGEEGDLAKLPGFLQYVAHNAELGIVPTKKVYDVLVAQLVDPDNIDLTGNAGALDETLGDIGGSPSQVTFSQEMAEMQEEDENEGIDLDEAKHLARTRRSDARRQGALHANLQNLLISTSTTDQAEDAALGAAVLASGWSAVSQARVGTGSAPNAEDFKRFERSLDRCHSAVRAVDGAQPEATLSQAQVKRDAACGGGALFLDYTSAMLAHGCSEVGCDTVKQSSLLWQLLHETNPSGASGQIEQVLRHCVRIIDAASLVLAAREQLAPSMAALPVTAGVAGQMWVMVTAAQRLLGLAVLAGSLPRLSGALYQAYLIDLKTPQSKQLFVETLPTAGLKMHLLDRLLCPGKQKANETVWVRLLSFKHCPSELRAPTSSASTASGPSRRAAASATGASKDSRERIPRLLLLYAAAQGELQGSGTKEVESREVGMNLESDRERFAGSLLAQQTYLATLLLA